MCKLKALLVEDYCQVPLKSLEPFWRDISNENICIFLLYHWELKNCFKCALFDQLNCIFFLSLHFHKIFNLSPYGTECTNI